MDKIINILIIDDDKSIIKLLTRYFEKHGMVVSSVPGAEELDSKPSHYQAHIILLDLLLPNVQGFTFLEKLRKKYPDTGIIVMTGNEDPVDKVVGLEIGADDYINKPFELREMLARIRSLHRRININETITKTDEKNTSENTKYFLFNGWRFEVRTKFLYSPENQIIKLTSLETTLLSIFLKSDNKTLERNRMLQDVFRREWRPDDRSIDMLISKIRKKLSDKDIIVNERTRGYRWTPETKKVW